MFISLTVILITLLLGVCDMVYAAEKTDKWEAHQPRDGARTGAS